MGKEKCRWTGDRLVMVKLMEEAIIDYGQVIYIESLGVGHSRMLNTVSLTLN